MMNPATHHVLYIYSSMTAFINIAFSQCNFSEGSEMNTLSTTTVAFDLLNGSGKAFHPQGPSYDNSRQLEGCIFGLRLF